MSSLRSGSIFVDQEGILATNANGVAAWRICWAQIVEIAAWKKDVFAYDLVCLGFRLAASADYFYCDEHQDGWDLLLSSLRDRFGIMSNEWLPGILLPAFEAKFTVLWRRSNGKDSDPC